MKSLIFFLLITTNLYAQPKSNALMQLHTTPTGNVNNPVDGSLIFDTDTETIKIYRDASWVELMQNETKVVRGTNKDSNNDIYSNNVQEKVGLAANINYNDDEAVYTVKNDFEIEVKESGLYLLIANAYIEFEFTGSLKNFRHIAIFSIYNRKNEVDKSAKSASSYARGPGDIGQGNPNHKNSSNQVTEILQLEGNEIINIRSTRFGGTGDGFLKPENTSSLILLKIN